MRRGRDSNPRCPKGHAGFQDQCNQPGSATPPKNFKVYLYTQFKDKILKNWLMIYLSKDIFLVKTP